MVVVVNNDCDMAPVKIKFVVSFSSQDKVHKASNLLLENGGTKRWLTDPVDRTGQIDAVFQLDQACHLSYIDIGVIWCASIEVRVGKSDWPQAHFTKEGGVGVSSWDRIQVIGRQPWRKDVQLGLSFLRVSCSDSVQSASDGCTLPSGAGSKARTTLSVAGAGSKARTTTLSVAAMELHFFGNKKDETLEDGVLKSRLQKMAATAEGVVASPDVLSRNARMVLLANKKCGAKAEPSAESDSAKAEPSAESDSATQQLPSTGEEDQQQTIIPEEVTQFLGTLNITKGDVESLKVSDLRHKFEKMKWRKLTMDEKRTFYNCCQNFIGGLFDDDAGDASTAPAPTPSTSTAVPEHSSHRNGNHRDAAGRASDGSRHSSAAVHRIVAPKAKDQEGRKATPSTSQNRAPNINGCKDGKSPRSGQRLSGGFLTNVSPMTAVTRGDNSSSVTPSKSVGKAQGGQGSSAGRCGLPSPAQLNGKLKAGSPSSKEKVSDGQRSGTRQNGKAETVGSYLCGETIHSGSKEGHKQRQFSSPASSESVPTSSINRSLLNTHRQFVKKRLESISSSRASKSVTSAAAATSSVGRGLVSDEEDAPAARSPSSVSQTSAKKRQGTLLSMSDSPVKQRPRFCSTPKAPGAWVNMGEEEEGEEWLNAKRDAGRGLGRGSCENSSNGRGGGRRTSSSRRSELENSPTPSTSTGYRGRGGRRGRGPGGPGAAKRRLDMPGEQTASTSRTTPTPRTSAAAASTSRPPPASHSNKSSSRSRNHSARTPKSPASSPEGGLKTPRQWASSRSRSPAAVVVAATDSEEELVYCDEEPVYCDLTTNDLFNGELMIDDPFRGELTIDDEVTAFVECPMCEEVFPDDTIQTHAADCPGKQPSAVGAAPTMVQCPLCDHMYAEDVIEQHAGRCGL